jgi:hypothetical protein
MAATNRRSAKPQIEFVIGQASGPLDSPLGADLRQLEQRIHQGDRAAIEARWEFGRRLLVRRGDAKQLERGLQEAIVTQHGISRSEVLHRMRFAAKYPDQKQVSNMLDTWRTWREITQHALYEKRVKAAPPKSTKSEGFVFDKIRHLLEMVDEQKLWLELDGLAMMLEKNLSGMTKLKLLEAAADTAEPDQTDKTDRGDQESGQPERERQSPPATDDGETSDRESPATTRIKITPLTDTEMNQLLCSAVISRELIEVFVNKDHDLITAAMIARPINRDLLYMSVAAAVAGELVDHPEVIAHLFPRNIVQLIHSRAGRQREGLVVRVLIDKARRAAA